MENKPVTTLLKVTSILTIIESVLAIFIAVLALILLALPGMTDLMAETGEAVEVTPLNVISIVVSLVCAVINIVLAVWAIKHKKLSLVYKIGIFTMLATEVFNATTLSSVMDYVQLAIGLILPLLFLYAVFQQNKIDQGK